MDSMVKFSDLEYDKEVEKEAIRLAAFSIIKAMFSEGMISESEWHYISDCIFNVFAHCFFQKYNI